MGSLAQRIVREFTYLRGSLRILGAVGPIAKNPTTTVCDVMEEACHAFADRVALIGERETLTYREYGERANRTARWARSQGIGKGDTVALLMANCPDYLCIWLGVARAGGATALINTNLRGQALAHSLAIVQARAVIVGPGFAEAYATARSFLPERPALWSLGAEAEGGTPSPTCRPSIDPIARP